MLLTLGRFRWNLQFFPIVIFIAVVIILLNLANWQLQRAEQKEIRLIKLKRLSVNDSLERLNHSENWQSLLDTKVKLQGHFDSQYYWLAENRVLNGKLGFDVLGLFYSHDLAHPVLVNMGWVASTPELTPKSDILIPESNIEITAIVQLPGDNPFASTVVYGDIYPKRLQHIDLSNLSRDLNLQLAPFVLVLANEEIIGFAKHWQAMVMKPEKHRAYAAQWFALAFAFTCLMVWRSGSYVKE